MEFSPKIQAEKARIFQQLHHSSELLVLPNAWDCVSAKLFEEAGFPAIATTSSGISWSCGYKDGEHIPPKLMKEVLGRMAQCVEVPVTADIEGAYFHDDLNAFSNYIKGIVQVGVVGINLEDIHAAKEGLNDLDHQIEKIKIARKAGEEMGVHLFINARTDAMDLPETSLREKTIIALKRAEAYQKAGADGIFVPFVDNIDTVEKLKTGIELPLNILAHANLPVKKLKEFGVNRVSVGSKPILASLGFLQQLLGELKNDEEWPTLYTENPGYRHVDNWF